MGRIQIVNGDLLKAEETYLVHQVNCCGVMGKVLLCKFAISILMYIAVIKAIVRNIGSEI